MKSLLLDATNPGRKYPVWRWVFLCFETALLTLWAVMVIQWLRGNRFINFEFFPVQARIVAAVFALSCLFLFIASPLFFRRLGVLAVVAWLTSLGAFIWAALPVF